MTLSNGSYTFSGDILLKNYLIAILVGFYMASVTIVFDVDEWSLLKQTVIHGLLNFPYIIIAFRNGWAPTGTLSRVVFILSYIVVYAIIWLCFKSYWSKKSRELNEKLAKLKTEDKKNMRISHLESCSLLIKKEKSS